MKKMTSAVQMNRLGIAHFVRGEFDQAIHAYQSAIDLQADYIDAYYNLGLALTKAGRREQAINAYEALLAISPLHLGARFQLGGLWMQRNKDKKALRYFASIEKTHPEHVETLVNLAACYFKLGYFNESKSRYLKALEITPPDTQILFNLGVINVHQGRLKEAIEFYLATLKIDADFHDAHNNLGVAYLALNDAEAALLHFRAALRINPNNEAVRHSINILTHVKNLSVSPPEYIRSLFDSYASHYDSHLLQSLRYQVPQHLLQMVKDFRESVNKAQQREWDILDIGCGTGLSGEVFKIYAHRLVGVDLSAKMLDIARQKHIYTELFEEDILAFLNSQDGQYDLIVGGDVLVYFGDLKAMFATAAQALKSQGLFVFNAEIHDNENYAMTDSGRFTHSKRYLDELAFQNQFTILQYCMMTMRTQEKKAVQGHFYLLQRQI